MRPAGALLALAVLLGGCVSASVQSSFLTDYSRPLDAVLLVTQFPETGGPFETALAEAVTADLEARGVTVTTRSVAADSTGPAAAEIAATGASSVLAIRLGEARTSTTAPGYNNPAMGPGFGGASGIGQNSRTELAVVLTDLETRAVVWTADVVAKGAGSSPGPEARKAAQRLVQTLDADGLLPPTPG